VDVENWSKQIISQAVNIFKKYFDPSIQIPSRLEDRMYKTAKSTIALIHKFTTLFELKTLRQYSQIEVLSSVLVYCT